MASVYDNIETTEKHVQERLDKGVEESVMLSNKSHVNNEKNFLGILICQTQVTGSKKGQ